MKNVVGGRVRLLRWKRGLRQRDLAARLQIAGWNADRVAVSKIESCLRCVVDYELLQLAKALRVNVADLFPKEPLPTGALLKASGREEQVSLANRSVKAASSARSIGG